MEHKTVEVLRTYCQIFIKDEKRRNRFLIVLGCIGLCLLLLSELSFGSMEKTAEYGERSSENEAYVNNMEKRISRLVEEVSGAGHCHVMITLEQGTQYVYASESKKTMDETQTRDGTESRKVQQKDNSENKIVVLEENGVSKPLIVTSKEPEIKGVVIVCEGGNSSAVQQRITELISTVLGIGSNQVCVVPSK